MGTQRLGAGDVPWGIWNCGEGLLKWTTVIEPEFPEVTEKYKATVWGEWSWGTGLYYSLPLGIDEAIPRLSCLHRV